MIIRLTENDLHGIIREATKSIFSNGYTGNGNDGSETSKPVNNTGGTFERLEELFKNPEDMLAFLNSLDTDDDNSKDDAKYDGNDIVYVCTYDDDDNVITYYGQMHYWYYCEFRKGKGMYDDTVLATCEPSEEEFERYVREMKKVMGNVKVIRKPGYGTMLENAYISKSNIKL